MNPESGDVIEVTSFTDESAPGNSYQQRIQPTGLYIHGCNG